MTRKIQSKFHPSCCISLTDNASLAEKLTISLTKFETVSALKGVAIRSENRGALSSSGSVASVGDSVASGSVASAGFVSRGSVGYGIIN